LQIKEKKGKKGRKKEEGKGTHAEGRAQAPTWRFIAPALVPFLPRKKKKRGKRGKEKEKVEQALHPLKKKRERGGRKKKYEFPANMSQNF